MTALKDRLVALIRAGGPITVADYMRLCLFDPAHGYYTRRDPFGSTGDFVTAPEISQMFGELVASWLVSAWVAAGRPGDPLLAEIGPGRGAMMRDMLRTLAAVAPEFLDIADIVLIEASPRLTDTQRAALRHSPGRIGWLASPADLPHRPLFIVGNELFDAVPVHQYVRTPDGWRERLVGLDQRDDLAFGVGPLVGGIRLGAEPQGSVMEIAPEREALMAAIAGHIADHGGACLFFDYGSSESGLGDTLQAVKAHAPDGVFDHPGEADLTTHVDFAALAAVARARGLEARIDFQGTFLTALGIRERAARLAAGRDAGVATRIAGECDRLIGDDAMGTLFKVLAIAPKGLALHPFAAG